MYGQLLSQIRGFTPKSAVITTIYRFTGQLRGWWEIQLTPQEKESILDDKNPMETLISIIIYQFLRKVEDY